MVVYQIEELKNCESGLRNITVSFVILQVEQTAVVGWYKIYKALVYDKTGYIYIYVVGDRGSKMRALDIAYVSNGFTFRFFDGTMTVFVNGNAKIEKIGQLAIVPTTDGISSLVPQYKLRGTLNIQLVMDASNMRIQLLGKRY
ncbi:hypothetical protein ACJJTC_017834 [Scirpophaga incertulas]